MIVDDGSVQGPLWSMSSGSPSAFWQAGLINPYFLWAVVMKLQPLCVSHDSLVFMLSWELAERGVWNRSAGCCFSLSEAQTVMISSQLGFYHSSFWRFAAGDDTNGSSKCNRHFTNTVRPSIKKNKSSGSVFCEPQERHCSKLQITLYLCNIVSDSDC